MKTHSLVPVLPLCLGLLSIQAAPPLSMQEAHDFSRPINKTLQINYWLFLPSSYSTEPGKTWPLLLFLHGAGERGQDLEKVTVHGPPKIVKQKPDFPFILVSPQCPENQVWDNEVLLHLLDEVEEHYRVDKRRVYLTGLSMGGYGTWSLGLSHPDRFAALAPICGGGDTLKILLASRTKEAHLKRLGVWAFHGAKDPVVPLDESERMVALLKKVGCHDVKMTVYPEAGHDSWTETYNNPGLYDWFLEHSRQP